MYLQHYQLNAKPFQITSDPKFLWLGEKHREALATLRYGIIDNRGILLLTGEVGTGKTILINRLIKMLDVDTVVATLPDPDLVSMDFYNMLADGFGMNRKFDSKGEFLIHLREFLFQSHANQKQVLLIIDESQRLNHFLMEDIRVLSNIEMDDRKLINVFFVGQQEFNVLLAAPQNRALAQRVTVRYHIAPLDRAEIGLYIKHRLKVAGGQQQLFSKSAIDEVFQFSGGIPRLINIICDHALLTGYARGAKLIDEKIIKECNEELRIPVKQSIHIQGDNSIAADSKSIASAVARTESHDEQKGQPETGGTRAAMPSHASIFLRRFWLLLVVLLAGVIGFIIMHYSHEKATRWDIEDLAPNKYLTNLEKEKELLSKQMQDTVPGDNPKGLSHTSSSDESLPAPHNETKLVQGDPQIHVSSIPSKTSEKNTVEKAVVLSPIVNSPQASSEDKKNKSESIVPNHRETLPESLVTEPPLKKDGTGTESLQVDAGHGIETIAPLPLMKEKVVIPFTLNSNEIDNNLYSVLDQIAEYMVKHADEKIYVRGYTDSSGSKGYNESVSQFRASAVKTYLIGKGAPAQNIIIFAMGDVNPLASNDTLVGRSRNRRVEIEFSPGKFEAE